MLKSGKLQLEEEELLSDLGLTAAGRPQGGFVFTLCTTSGVFPLSPNEATLWAFSCSAQQGFTSLGTVLSCKFVVEGKAEKGLSFPLLLFSQQRWPAGMENWQVNLKETSELYCLSRAGMEYQEGVAMLNLSYHD